MGRKRGRRRDTRNAAGCRDIGVGVEGVSAERGEWSGRRRLLGRAEVERHEGERPESVKELYWTVKGFMTARSKSLKSATLRVASVIA